MKFVEPMPEQIETLTMHFPEVSEKKFSKSFHHQFRQQISIFGS